MASHLNYIDRAFPWSKENEEIGNCAYFEQCPVKYDIRKLESFQGRCNSRLGRLLFDSTKKFQGETVKRWNDSIDDPSLSIYLGLLGIDEAASKECGAITLDLLLRAGVLVSTDKGSWELAENWESRRVYLYGDAKTIENVTKFVRDMQERRISYTTANIQSEVFLQALTVVMEAPGDWHSGMNMLQSIYNVYYPGFLDQFQGLLNWKRVTKEVRSCYFQASRLVTFVSDELMRFFLHQFIAERTTAPEDDNLRDSAFIAKVTMEFMSFLKSLKESDDQ